VEIKIKTGDAAKAKTPCLILGVFAKHKLSGDAEAIDRAAGGIIAKRLKGGDLDGESGSSLLLYDLPGIAAERVLLMGLGKRKELDRTAFDKALDATFKRLAETRAPDALFTLPDPLPQGMDHYQCVRDVAATAICAGYRYEHTKKKPESARDPMRCIHIHIADKSQASLAETAAAHGHAIGEGMNLARDLGNLPGNICTPTYLAGRAQAMAAADERIHCEVLDEDAMEELKMGALLSVSRGSREPAKLILMHYLGGRDGDKPVALVGKGLTFDAGGISIKPAAEMDEMKYDMCGGASVFGAIHAAAAMALPINIVGIVPASENLPDGAANKPGDIVTSLSGQTIEILNTDAEGRLILCDALTYAERFDPEIVLDMATLTGACIVALGRHASGLFTNDDKLAAEVLAAGEASGDRAWRLPLWKDYDSQLDSNFADMANIGGRDAGAITAAAFLARYTKKLRWAHLDIAGTAWVTGKEKGATGRPVALLSELLIRRSGTRAKSGG
jgi:leucyl aminopeptidase